MMVIGANTPAMIKAMTTEVESKNFIVASNLCVDAPVRRKFSGGHITALNRAVPALPCIAPG